MHQIRTHVVDKYDARCNMFALLNHELPVNTFKHSQSDQHRAGVGLATLSLGSGWGFVSRLEILSAVDLRNSSGHCLSVAQNFTFNNSRSAWQFQEAGLLELLGPPSSEESATVPRDPKIVIMCSPPCFPLPSHIPENDTSPRIPLHATLLAL